MKKVILFSCFIAMSFFPFAQPYLPQHSKMEKFTVFNFSQNWDLTIPDNQVFRTMPDMIIRGWCNWNNWGTAPSDFNFSIIEQYHKKKISFIGGVTASVYFFDQAEDSAQFMDMVTRDASGKLVPHNILGQGAYRGNIANPAYRDYIIRMAKIQIAGGADGIFFDEVISGYDGLKYDGNEGFDDYTLKDFNKFLAAKYPDYSVKDWINKFQMTQDNFINNCQPLDDLQNNFNYRKYLTNNGWQNNPLNAANPLAAEWGKVLNNRADTLSDSFLSKYTTFYWKDIVSQTRSYASDTLGKEILVTANGLFPFVDFNSLGLYNGNHDDNGSEVNYVPTTSGYLNGSESLQHVFKNLYGKSVHMSGLAPVVLFIDWPTKSMDDYYNLSLDDKKDYWKIYTAEAYANGLFMAFHLRTAMPGDPTADEQGILDFLTGYASFYKDNTSCYHKNKIVEIPISEKAKGVNYSMMYYPETGSYTLHLVNHNYIAGKGIMPVKDLTVSLSLPNVPETVYMKSPDFKGSRILSPEYENNLISIKIDTLSYYNVIVLEGSTILKK